MSHISKLPRRRFVASALPAAAWMAVGGGSRMEAAPQKIEGDQMTTLTSYLLFDGTCHAAMEFYNSCFGGDLSATKVKDSPVKDQMPAAQHEKIIYARLKSSCIDVSASDWLSPNGSPIRGNTVCLFLSGGTAHELKTLFEKLSDGAEVTTPLREQFFGLYGALNDKFGVRWMFQTNNKV